MQYTTRPHVYGSAMPAARGTTIRAYLSTLTDAQLVRLYRRCVGIVAGYDTATAWGVFPRLMHDIRLIVQEGKRRLPDKRSCDAQ